MEEQINMTEGRVRDLLKEKKFIKKLEELKVNVKTEGNTVILRSDSAFNAMLVKAAITAFNRGFPPNIALLLLGDEYDLKILSLNDYTQSKKRQEELRGRVIGARGAVKDTLSRVTACHIRVQGKTISIIGVYGKIDVAVDAIDMLLRGAKHSTVFRMVDRRLTDLIAYG